jgi:hypothetical protein
MDADGTSSGGFRRPAPPSLITVDHHHDLTLHGTFEREFSVAPIFRGKCENTIKKNYRNAPIYKVSDYTSLGGYLQEIPAAKARPTISCG